MKHDVDVLRRARRDVDGVLAWLAARSRPGAAAWLEAYERALDRIAENPLGYALAPEAHDLRRELREAPFKTRAGKPYRIVFTVVEDEVRVLRVRGPGQADLAEGDVS